MAKALFLSLPMRGHVNPSLPLIRELAERGDDIVYYSEDQFAAEVTTAGARYRPYRPGSLDELLARFARTETLPWLLVRASANALDAELPSFQAERPDYIITDSVAPWGQWAALILRVPVVTSVSTFAFNRQVMRYGAARGVRPTSARLAASKLRHVVKAALLSQRLRRRHGVKGPGPVRSVIGRSDLNIVYTSRQFQPCADSFDDRFQFVGPSLRAPEETRFPWDRMRQDVVVYVSLGTLFNTDAQFYRNCFEAFAGEGCGVIVSTGTGVAPDSLGRVPANVIVQSHVPQLEVLSRADAFVTHGGMNSVSESLWHGVPMVVVPQMGEQAIVGRRVEDLGAGLYLPKEDASPGRLRDSVRQILAAGRFGAAASSIGASLRAAGGVRRAADAVVAFTR